MAENFDLLDSTIEDLVDLPVYKPFPAGSYKFLFNWEPLEDDKTKKVVGVRFLFVHQETLETANPEDAETIEQGKKFTLPLNTVKKDGDKNEFAEGTIKMVLTALKESFAGNSVREILDAAAGCEVGMTISLRQYKDKNTGEDRAQNEIKNIELA